MAVRHAAGQVRVLDELVVIGRDIDQGEREDAHEAAVALVALAGPAGIDGRNAGAQPAQRRGGRAPDTSPSDVSANRSVSLRPAGLETESLSEAVLLEVVFALGYFISRMTLLTRDASTWEARCAEHY
jgi:hypothetical protein